jgi:hypothetical protein
MRSLFLAIGTWLITLFVQAQDPKVLKYGNQINANDLKEYLSILASDAMEGRETGKRGQKMAAAFISNHFEELGLKAPASEGYYQPVPLYSSEIGEVYIKSESSQFNNLEDVIYYGNADSNGEASLELVYLGLGREADFDLIDVKDKAVLLRVSGNKVYNIPEVTRARQKGAKIVFVWNSDSEQEFKKLSAQSNNYGVDEKLSLRKPKSDPVNAGMFIVSPKVAAAITNTPAEKLLTVARADPKKKALDKIKPTTINYKVANDLITVKTENVLGFLEGTDKKDEVIVITAHYDHIGKSEKGSGDLINNGADDDGSGTVAVMELAGAFAQAKKDGVGPRRSILFMLVTGEEKGLLGSEYYTNHPVFPLEKTVVNLNMDMIGRRDSKYKADNNYIYVIGSDRLSTELHKLNERINNTYTKLNFDYVYNDENHPERLYYRSDHWNFAKNNIPVIFYFDGIHEDYHKPSDEVSKIEFDILTKRAQCVFYTAWEIANREERIVPDGK